MEARTERWLGVDELAEHLGVAAITIYRYLEKGDIPCSRIGKLWRFKASEVDAWIAKGGAEEGSERKATAKKTTHKTSKKSRK